MAGGRYRLRSKTNIIKELKNIKKLGYSQINFVDDTFTANISRLLELLDKIKSLTISWTCESRVDVMAGSRGLEVAKEMANAGCFSLQFGIESGSQDLLNKVRKGTNLNQIEEAISNVRAAGIQVMGSMMIGLPDESPEETERSIEFATYLEKEYNIMVLVGITTPYPGTFLYKHAEDLGIDILSKNYDFFNMGSPVIKTPFYAPLELRNAHMNAMTLLLKDVPKSQIEGLSRSFELLND